MTVSCSDGNSLQITIAVDVDKSPDTGNPAQYGYDETPAESVYVYVTMSSDGVPLMGNDTDNTVLSHLKVNVPYFDLSLYGLEDYYRYHTYVVSIVPKEREEGVSDIGNIVLRLYGDINNDGKLRAGDATQICRYIAGNTSVFDNIE